MTPKNQTAKEIRGAPESAPGPSSNRRARTSLKQRGVITIPADIRRAARLEEGDPIDVEITEDGILLRPMKLIDATQAWFWTPEWQAKERQAEEEVAAGKSKIFLSEEDFLEYLKELDQRAEGAERGREA